jgi:hypothetical protein
MPLFIPRGSSPLAAVPCTSASIAAQQATNTWYNVHGTQINLTWLDIRLVCREAAIPSQMSHLSSGKSPHNNLRRKIGARVAASLNM